ncbi:MAG: hypothetical protein PHC75_07635 [Burkholderiales bacterium]|nr:hypothetical protein [Burkholderiales bacterium]
MKLKLSVVCSLLMTFFLFGCGSTPNDIVISSAPGVCVNSKYPSYESGSFPINTNMPESSPYCMAYTITNNNSGENSNNIQVYHTGLQLTYSVESLAVSSPTLWDFGAAGFTPGSGYAQTVGGLTLFDPENCVTTYGRYVNTLNKNGGQCTFYLQVTTESMPIGNYPVNLSINYTNGNDNYYLTDSFHYHVDMIAGGNFTAPDKYLAKYNGNSNNIASPIFVNALNPLTESVQLLARGAIGNIYAYAGESIYSLGAESKLVALPVISNPMPVINQLKGDKLGNIFAATGNGIYVYRPYAGNNSSWMQLTGGVSGNVVSMHIESTNVLYYSSNQSNLSQIESCVYSVSSSGASCAGLNVIFESANGWVANNQALVYNSYGKSLLFGATQNNLSNVYSGSSTYLADSGGVINQNGALGADAFGTIYAASLGSVVTDYAAFSNVLLANMMSPVKDESGGYLYGKAHGTNVRNFVYSSSVAYMNLFVYGDLLYSILNPGGGYIAYLPMIIGTNSSSSNIFIANNVWSYIGGFNGSVNDVVVYSYLSNN